MPTEQPEIANYNRNLYLGAVAVSGLCAYRLLVTAAETGNWRGAWFSLAHVLLVAAASVLAIRQAR